MSQDKTACSVDIIKGQIGQAYIEVHMYTVSAEMCPPFMGLPFILATVLFCILKILSMKCKNCFGP